MHCSPRTKQARIANMDEDIGIERTHKKSECAEERFDRFVWKSLAN